MWEQKIAMKKFDISNLIVKKICDIYSQTVEEETKAESVTSCSLLILKRRGRSVYRVGERELIADPNHILYLPAEVAYSLYVDREGACTVIELETEGAVREAATSYFINNESDILLTAKNLLHYWTLRGPAYHSKCLSEIYSLLTQISTIQSYTDTLAGKYGLIHRSVQYIERNYGKQDLYTPMLADMSGMGETYYRSIFLAVFGIPPTKYIQRYRVEKAKELLVTSSYSVDEIAQKVGFANASYFCKVFKSLTKLTPSEFVEKAGKIG